MKTNYGNIVENVTSGIIIQQVNAQGVMNSGVAKDIRKRYPKVWDEYSALIKPNPYHKGAAHMGRMIPVRVSDDLVICNIISQQFYGREPERQPYRRYTSYDALDFGLQQVAEFAIQNSIHAVHFPLIGCGLGGGNWVIVGALLEHWLSFADANLWLIGEQARASMRVHEAIIAGSKLSEDLDCW